MLVIALNLLHDDFEITTAPLLHLGDKDLKEIQQIVTSTEAASMTKWATGQTADLVMITKKRLDKRQQTPNPKANEECFNCEKKGHYARDCYSNLKKKLKDEKAVEEAKRARWKRNQATEKAAAARSINQDNESDPKLYPPIKHLWRSYLVKKQLIAST